MYISIVHFTNRLKMYVPLEEGASNASASNINTDLPPAYDQATQGAFATPGSYASQGASVTQGQYAPEGAYWGPGEQFKQHPQQPPFLQYGAQYGVQQPWPQQFQSQ